MKRKSKKILSMTTKSLLKLKEQIEKEIEERKNRPLSEDDIAENFKGEDELIAKVYQREERSENKSRVLVTAKIFCCKGKCDKCPHGPFSFQYKFNKSGTLVDVAYKGRPVFDLDFLEKRKRELDNLPPPAIVPWEDFERMVETGEWEQIDLDKYRKQENEKTESKEK
jgi:hypothetical protein